MSVVNYFFEKHIERCKKELSDFDNNKFKDVREDLKLGTRKQINEAEIFFNSIQPESYTDFEGFNKEIKNLNDELNRIMKFSANISSLVYVMPDVNEEDYYTYTDFISYFSYDENKFNNADERDIKYLKLLDKYLEKINDDFEVYKERGDLRAELGLYNEAIDDYKKSIELNTDYGEAKQALEEINKKLTNTKTINTEIKTNSNIEMVNTEYEINQNIKTINILNKYSEEFYKEGINYNNAKKHNEALKSFDKAIELNPNNSLAYIAKGNIKDYLGQYEEAIKDYDKAIELDPNNSVTYNSRGNAKNYLGKDFEAIKDYDKAIELDPNYSLAYNNRGVSKKNLGQYQEALKDYEKALELDPNNKLFKKNIKNIQY